MLLRMLSKLRRRPRRARRVEGKASVKGRVKRRGARQTATPPKRPQIVFVLAAAATAFIVLLTIFGERGLVEVYSLKHKVSATSEEISSYEQKNKELLERIDKLKHDPFTIEQIAREELGLVRPGETVYEFVDEPPSHLRPE